MKQPAKQLTFNKNQYRLCKGHETKLNGSRGPKVWMLGSDIRSARSKAAIITSEWDRLTLKAKAAGKNKTEVLWDGHLGEVQFSLRLLEHQTTEAFQQVQQFNDLASDGGHVTTEQPLQVTPQPRAVSKPSGRVIEAPASVDGVLTLAGAARLYNAKLQSDVASKDRSDGNASRRVVSVKNLLRFITDTPYNPATDPAAPKGAKLVEYIAEKFSKPSALASVPLDRIGWDQISSFVANMKNREVSQFAPATIKTSVEQCRDFFGWLEDSRKWQPTCNYTRLLSVEVSKLMTLNESKKLRSGQDTFTTDELQHLYATATTKAQGTSRHSLYLLLGLNLLATQQQLSDLLVDDVIWADGQPVAINFIRGKTRHINRGTGVEGRYPLWPETAQALKQWLTNNPPQDEYLLASEEGRRLVVFNGISKTDSVSQSWCRLLTAAGALRPEALAKASEEAAGDFVPPVRWLGLKHLRKTTAEAVKVLAGGGAIGEFFQQLALAHSNKTVAGMHYSGSGSADQDFSTLADLLHRVRSEALVKMFEAPERPVLKKKPGRKRSELVLQTA